ncbi:MAG: hypothetical protein QOE28_709 [Solirubrobacteraceae bacterium]|jgi:hypothetical protein|nr:hypothetical protein [Solirubrobacteraceae bacterium]
MPRFDLTPERTADGRIIFRAAPHDPLAALKRFLRRLAHAGATA